jgi:hypothetical protein
MTSPLTRSSIPAFFLGVGVVCLVAAGVGNHIILGLVMLAVMAASALAVFLLARRSETYRGLTEAPDERFALIGERAWAGTGVVLTIANLGAFIGNLAAGHSSAPYYWLVVAAAVAYSGFAAFFVRVS